MTTARHLSSFKKDQIVREAERITCDTDWLPALLRSANDTLQGSITSLNLDCSCTFLPVENCSNDRAPSYRVVLTRNHAIEIGTVWPHNSKKAGDYLVIHIDSPFSPAPIKTFAFQSKYQKKQLATATVATGIIYRQRRGRRMKPDRFFLTLAIIGTCFSSLSGIVPAHCQTMTATISKHKNGDERYQNSIHIASKKFDIPSSWIGAVISVESNWTPRAVSFAGAVGLMQLMPKTYDDMHRQYGLGRDSFETHDNIMAGMAYLKQMHGKFGREGFLAAHNAGPGLYQKHLSGHRSLPRETRSYVAKLEAIFDGKMPKNRRENPSHDVAIWASSPLLPAENLATKSHHRKWQTATKPSRNIQCLTM